MAASAAFVGLSSPRAGLLLCLFAGLLLSLACRVSGSTSGRLPNIRELILKQSRGRGITFLLKEDEKLVAEILVRLRFAGEEDALIFLSFPISSCCSYYSAAIERKKKGLASSAHDPPLSFRLPSRTSCRDE